VFLERSDMSRSNALLFRVSMIIVRWGINTGQIQSHLLTLKAQTYCMVGILP
jgi:hypothetical protein